MRSQCEVVPRNRRMTGTALILLACMLLAGSAVVKLAHVQPMTDQLAAMGFAGGRLTFVAALEVLGVALLLVPATRSVGVPWVSAYLGGAIATHLQHGQPILPPALVLSLVWIGAWLRHPEVAWSLRRGAPASARAVRAKFDGRVPQGA